MSIWHVDWGDITALEQLIEKYYRKAETSSRRGNYDNASLYLSKAGDLHKKIGALTEKIQRREEEIRRRQEALYDRYR